MVSPHWKSVLQRTLRNHALWKKKFNSKCVDFGTRSTHFHFFPNCVDIKLYINAIWKRNWIKIFARLALFFLVKTFKEMNRSFQTLIWRFICQAFSSPELKAQMSFSDRLSSVVCLSVRLYVNFSYFRLLLKNHWANCNQTWHKASLVKGDSSLFKWRAIPEIANLH